MEYIEVLKAGTLTGEIPSEWLGEPLNAEVDSEREAIERVLRGDKEQFSYLVRAHQTLVYSSILRQVGNEAIARELAQDTFVRAFRHLKNFRFESRFSTWLVRIAINVSSSYLTSRQHQQQLKTVELPADREFPAEASDEVQHRELVNHLRSHINNLKPRYRDVLVLCCFENKPYKEAAEILGVPVGTVCSRMNTALNLLRRKFRVG